MLLAEFNITSYQIKLYYDMYYKLIPVLSHIPVDLIDIFHEIFFESQILIFYYVSRE